MKSEKTELLQAKYDVLQTEYNTLQGKLQTVMELLGAMDFELATSIGKTDGTAFRHRRAKACWCGAQPKVEKCLAEPGTWIVRCPECAGRSREAQNPIMAVKAWNNDEVTEETRMLRKPLTANSIDTDGARELLQAIKQNAVDTLAAAEKVKRLDTPEADQARWFIKDKKMIEYVESGEYRARLAEETAKRKEKNRKELEKV